MLSPGLGDGEAALAGLVEESGFGTFSGALGVGTIGIVGLAGVKTVAHGDPENGCGLLYIYKLYFITVVKLGDWGFGRCLDKHLGAEALNRFALYCRAESAAPPKGINPTAKTSSRGGNPCEACGAFRRYGFLRLRMPST
jgi:hypothetical protein